MKITGWITVLLLALSSSVSAARLVNLYADEAILAQSASQTEQNNAVRDAFGRVLVRVTGDAEITRRPAVQSALRNANDYLSTFRFERSDVTLTNVLGEAVATNRMVMQFDSGSIEQLLVRNRLPIWGRNRAETLVWLADRLDGQDRILGDTDQTEWARALRQAATNRGVPLTLPLMDLTDTFELSFTDVYGLFTNDVLAASERYPHDAVLIGRIERQGEAFQANFVYMIQNDRQRFEAQGRDEAELMANLIDRVTRRLADQYAVVLDPALAGRVALRINEVNDLDALAEVERYLKSQNLITKATLRQVEPGSLLFDLNISGDQAQLRDTLALDAVLTPVQQFDLFGGGGDELVYRWAR